MNTSTVARCPHPTQARPRLREAAAIACFLVVLLTTVVARAETTTFIVRSTSGDPVPNVVIATGGVAESTNKVATMDQQNKKFLPFVLPVLPGSEVSFPNSDQIRHHVYSFSAPKRFEIRLYSGEPGETVTFDEPGVVVLGCNIHDNMIAYIYVTDRETFGTTNANGEVTLTSDSPIDTIEVWHPSLSLDAMKRLSFAVDSLDKDGDTSVIELGIDTPPAEPQAVEPNATDRFRRFLPN